MRRRAYLQAVASGAVVAGVGTKTGGIDRVAQTGSAVVTGEWRQEAKLVADDGDADDAFGALVALDGERALVSAPQDDDPNGKYAGSAYIFEREDEGWTQQAKLAADEGSEKEFFGVSVALDGETALVGAHNSGDERLYRDEQEGSAYVFERDGDEWIQQAELVADDGKKGNDFGRAVALDGERALISAPFGDSPKKAGSVYVFERDGDEWPQQAKFVAADGDGDDQFGTAVALDGERALVGADENGDNRGAAYVFEHIEDEWTQQATLAAADGDHFGASVALDGERALIGAWSGLAPDTLDGGSAYVFERDTDEWTQQARLTADDGERTDRFGDAVALDGKRALVSARRDDNWNGEAAGSAYVFEGDGDEWTQQAKLAPNGANGDDELGYSVALDGERALVSAHNGDNSNGEEAGSAYLLARNEGRPTATREIASQTVPAGESTDVTVSVSTEEPSDGLELTERFDPGLEVSSVTDDDAIDSRVSGDELTVSWSGVSEVTITYELRVPDDAETGTTFRLLGTVLDHDADNKAAVTGDSTIDVGNPVAEYANDHGVVDTAGLLEAAADFWDGEIGAGLLMEVAAAFRSNEPVV